jgi:large subunit ribosomal protein L9
MKVILLTDVPKVGNRYDVKDFKEGYAQNVLLSKGLAELATPAALARLADKKAKIHKQKEDEARVFAELIAAVDNKKITLKAKANEKSHLFSAVSARDIVKAIKDSSGVDIDEHTIVMKTIKEIGIHSVVIKKGDKKGTCQISVEPL